MTPLSGYQIGELLRAGRQYHVYRAVREADGAAVIVKCLAERSKTEQAAARLEREYALTRALDEPGVVSGLALVETGDGPALVFPDHGGESLHQRLQQRALPLAEALDIALQLAGTLSRLHAQGVIHKDIKPGNIIIGGEPDRVRLIDFGIAIRLGRERASQAAVSQLEGTVAYMAPEQTGRMNRSIDPRSDLYSLGVLLFQMLTGRLPFDSDDPAELVHQHLTRPPPDPHTLDGLTPVPIARLVLRLLAKDPQDRYQSAAGLAHDLGWLAEMIAANTPLDGFEPGRHDVPEQLCLSERLYGREQALALIEQAIERAATGTHGFLRLTGRSGIGKSALVRELARPIAGRRGHFISGKFDQFSRDRPYSAIAQAFEDLGRRLLGGTEKHHDYWRQRLLAALSPNAQLIIDLLPGFERLLGKQPAAAPLGLNENAIRFSLVFRRFVRSLASAEQPLVLFLDDLQWADAASRALLKSLLGDRDINHFLLIGAYRDNEVGPGHPLALLFSELDEVSPLPPPLLLGGLDPVNLTALLADSLRLPAAAVAELADCVHAKSDGNPFFARQFLETLGRKGLLAFDPAHVRWQWDLHRIGNEPMADNVVDLVIERIEALPPATAALVQLAACIGNAFELRTLALVAQTSLRACADQLEPALAAEIVLPDSESYLHARSTNDPHAGVAAARYRFQHDRVQHAANAMQPPGKRSELHGRIGRLLLREVGAVELEDRLTEIVDHLNAAGVDPGDDRNERVKLNLRAARKVKAATAYEAALCYLEAAAELLGAQAWSTHPAQALELHQERAEAAYLTGRFELAEACAEDVLRQPLAVLDRVRTLELLLLLHTTRLAYPQALQLGLHTLRLLGTRLPERGSEAAVLVRLLRSRWTLRNRPPEDLLMLPRCNDPQVEASMRLLVQLAPSAYFAAPNLLPLIGLRLVELSARHGNNPNSAYGYALYGLLHCAVFGAMPTGLAWGRLALDVVDRLDARDSKGRVYMIYAGFVLHWSSRLTDTLPLFLEGAEAAIEAGDIEHHGYLRYGHVSYALMGGVALAKVSDLLDHHYAAVVEHLHEKTQRIMQMARQAIRELRGLPLPMDAAPFDEAGNEALWTAQRDATSLAYLHKFRMLRSMMAGDWTAVLTHARGMDRNINGIVGMAFQPFYLFYKALALIILAPSAALPRRLRMRAEARVISARLRRWARHAPQTLRQRVALLDAEAAASRGNRARAMQLFDRAIRLAHAHRAPHDEALACERAAQFYMADGASTAARAHLRRAQACYRQWGAHAWSDALRRRHPDLLGIDEGVERQRDVLTVVDSESSSALIDFAPFLRSARAIAEQVSLADAMAQVMRAVLLDAGASRGLLLLYRDGRLAIEAEARAGGEVVNLAHRELDDHAGMAIGIVNFVTRSLESVVLGDAALDPVFGDDPHIQRERPLSILCAPLLRKGALAGVVYLEHPLSRDAFTHSRVQTVEMLCAQAAIAVENAQLYDDLRHALEQQVELTSAHARFVPHQFLETLGRRNIVEVALGDHALIEASILFSDLRGFTRLVERLSVQPAIELINAYLAQMEPAILAEEGFVDSYNGDGIMALFHTGAEHAVAAAIGMQRRLTHWNAFRQAEGEPGLAMGIGIASGDILLGTIGAPGRIKCGVIGDSVNLASRVEGLTKQYGLALLIDGGTWRRLPRPDRFLIREIDRVQVVGREQAVDLYEVFDADPEPLRLAKHGCATLLAEAIDLYRGGSFTQARAIFERCVEAVPGDPVPAMYLERCERPRHSGAEWSPVERIGQK
jgi:predicted ATPase/class 3 adenylate cyclase/tRNA A-37 threonylcarbamoyl transferase component Bud32